jgi:hypothetical protein
LAGLRLKRVRDLKKIDSPPHIWCIASPKID